MERRKFILQTGGAAAATLLAGKLPAANPFQPKMKIAMVGTGHRGTSMWGAPVIKEFSDLVEFVGLCDINPGLPTVKDPGGGRTCWCQCSDWSRS